MAAVFVIFLREGVEASMIVSILLAYLHRIGKREHFRDVLLGVGAALFLAARIQLARETILPALDRGVTVIADRYLDSSLVYQGARGVPTAPLLEIHRLCGLDRVPDLTLLLDLEVESARSRRREGESIDRLEAEPTPYHERVRAGYLELARRFPERIKVVGADRDPDEVARDCLEMVRARMST